MEIKNNYNPNFKAKFIDCNDLRQVVNYAIEHGKADKLNETRKNIESSYLTTRLTFSLGETDNGFPKVVFTRLKPKSHVLMPEYYKDYVESKPIEYVYTAKNKSKLAYALDLLIRMGSCVPNNKVFRKVVIKGGGE